jgi:hypothetical protein
MSSRNHVIAVSALLLASLCGAATPVNAGDTKPLVPESCESGKRVNRSFGHPGKSALFPQRNSVQCSRPVRKSLTLAAYEDVPGGRALVAGKTERAIELIYAKQAKPVSAQTLINLCVAHTVLRQFEEATETCDAAVESANAKRADTRYRAGTSRKSLDEGAAVAYSNRAVLHLLSRNTLAAQNDLAHARSIAPKAFFVMRNSAAASQAPSLAQAAQVSVSIE